jgi:hypothetical protein
VADDRLDDLASRLLELTKSDKARWTAEPAPDDAPEDWQPRSFTTAVADATVTIASEKPEGRYPFSLRVSGVGGTDVASIETGEDAEQWLGDREAEPWEAVLHDLYAAAREAAVDADATLDSVLGELRKR